MLRVGLVSDFDKISSVDISNSSLSAGFQKDDVFYGSESILGTNFSVKSGMNYYISSQNIFSSYIDAKNNSGDKGIPALVDVDCWKVYFGGYSSEREAVSQVENFLKYGVNSVVKSSENITVLLNENIPIAIFDSLEYYPQFKDGENGNIIINNLEFRGNIEFVKSNSTYTLVNVLPIEEYLYGVLPAEISNEWHLEALKAQAVASRCFALFSKNGKHSSDCYDLCNLSHCQVYKGVSAEKTETTIAVDLTKNILAYYNNEIIEATYFASSGGSTADAKDVWNVSIPYLKAVSDSSEKESKVWTRAFSFDEMTQIVDANGENVGNVINAFISSKDTFGRVNALVIEGTKGSLILEGEEIKSFFSKSNEGSLLSRNFSTEKGYNSGKIDISYNNKVYIMGKDKTNSIEFESIKALSGENKNISFLYFNKIFVLGKAESKFYDKSFQSNSYLTDRAEDVSGDIVFYGKGMGHGVGMSQAGAKALAENGYDYIEILKHYYTGIEVKERL